MIQNRRKFGRIDAQREPCVVRLNGNETEAILLDESIGGLRVGGLSLLHLLHDQEISVTYYDDTVVGRCRDVKRDANNLFEIGILRDLDPDNESTTSALINAFMDFDGRLIACVPRRIVDEDKMEIVIPGGKEFIVYHSQVKTLTRTERSNQLLDNDACMMVGEAYNAIYNQTSFNSRQAILLHEYGPPQKSQ